MKSKTSFSFQALSLNRRSPDAGIDHRFGLHPHDPARGVLPQRHVVLPKTELRLHQPGWVGHQPRGHLHEGAADIQRISRVILLRLALQPLAHQTLRTFGDIGHRAAHHRGIRHLEPAVSGCDWAVGAWGRGLGVPVVLSFEAIETSFASATPAATQAAGSGERNQHMVVSERGAQARRAKKPGQAGTRGSAMPWWRRPAGFWPAVRRYRR